MGALLQLLEHLITSGPARNPAELERLLQLLEDLRGQLQPAPDPAPGPGAPAAAPDPGAGVSVPPAPVPYPDQPGGGQL